MTDATRTNVLRRTVTPLSIEHAQKKTNVEHGLGSSYASVSGGGPDILLLESEATCTRKAKNRTHSWIQPAWKKAKIEHTLESLSESVRSSVQPDADDSQFANNASNEGNHGKKLATMLVNILVASIVAVGGLYDQFLSGSSTPTFFRRSSRFLWLVSLAVVACFIAVAIPIVGIVSLLAIAYLNTLRHWRKMMLLEAVVTLSQFLLTNLTSNMILLVALSVTAAYVGRVAWRNRQSAMTASSHPLKE